MAETKTYASVDEYIAAHPPSVQSVLENVRRTIRSAAPDTSETISYGIPTFDLNGKHLVFFAGWKRHISVYPLPAGDDAFQQELAQYKQARGSVQFPLNQPTPYALIERLVTFLLIEKPAQQR